MTKEQFIEALEEIENTPSRHVAIAEALQCYNIETTKYSTAEIAVICKFGSLEYTAKRSLINTLPKTTNSIFTDYYCRTEHLVFKEYSWLPNKYTNHVKKTRIQATFDANKKDIKLDMFSFKIFKKYLEDNYSGKKKLPGTEVMRYLKALPSYKSPSEQTIISQYRNLLWEYSRKPETLAAYLAKTVKYTQLSSETVCRYQSEISYNLDTILVLNNYEFYNLARSVGLLTPDSFAANTQQTVTGIVKEPKCTVEKDWLLIKAAILLSYINNHETDATNKSVLKAHYNTLIQSAALWPSGVSSTLTTNINNYLSITESFKQIAKDINE